MTSRVKVCAIYSWYWCIRACPLWSARTNI